jgi:hypothetical protein
MVSGFVSLVLQMIARMKPSMFSCALKAPLDLLDLPVSSFLSYDAGITYSALGEMS